jgi:hypothetical protein
MPTIEELRDQYPMYNRLDDDALLNAYNKKFGGGEAAATTAPVPQVEEKPKEPDYGDLTQSQYEVRGLARSALGQGLGMGFGDEIEAYARSKLGDESYDTLLERIRGQQKDFSEAYPTASTTAEVAGGVGSMFIPGGAVAQGVNAGLKGTRAASALAQTGKALGRVGKEAAKGSAYGAGYGFGTGEGGLENRATGAAGGALVGGLVGGGAVPVTEGVKKVAQKYIEPGVRAVFQPKKEAAYQVAKAMDDDLQSTSSATKLGDRGLRNDEFDIADQAGYPVRNIDRGGEATRRLADAAVVRSGAAGGELKSMLNDRQMNTVTGQAARYNTMFDSMLPGGGSAEARAAVREAGQNATRPLYTLANMHPKAQQMWTPELEQLTQSDLMQKAMKGALSTGTNEAAVRGFNPIRHPFQIQKLDDGTEHFSWKEGAEAPNLAFWDQTKKNLDATIDSGTDVTGKMSFEAKQAVQLKNKLVSHLDATVPAYQTARLGAGKYLGEESASKAAEKMFKGGSNWKSQDVQRAVAKWTPEEKAQGRVAWLDELRNRSQNIGDSIDISPRLWRNAAERQKAATMLSPQDMNQIEAANLVEGLMAKPRKEVQGSQTAARQVAQAALHPFTLGVSTAGGVGYGTGGDWQSTLGYGGAAFLTRKGQMILGDRLAREAVKILTSKDPAAIQAFTQRIADDPKVMGRLRLMQHPAAVVGGQSGADAF